MNEKKQKPNDVGFVVTTEDLYQLIEETRMVVQRILIEVEVTKNKVETITGADERSREALDTAQDALELARKTEAEVTWLWRTIISGLVVSAIGSLFLLVEKGLK